MLGITEIEVLDSWIWKRGDIVQIEYKKNAVKYINSCKKPTKQRLKAAIEELPQGDVKKLSGYENDYRLRVGDLRILFSIENEIITVNNILPRGQAYKRI